MMHKACETWVGALLTCVLFTSPTLAESDDAIIWPLLDDAQAVFVSVPENEFRSLGSNLELPDNGRNVIALADAAPGGAFDPRALDDIPAAELGYRADWLVERFSRYNLFWDITGLRLTSLDPEASNYPWIVIINGGAANFF